MTTGSCFTRQIEKQRATCGFDLQRTKLDVRRREGATDTLNQYRVAKDGWCDSPLAVDLVPATFKVACERWRQVEVATADVERRHVIIARCASRWAGMA